MHSGNPSVVVSVDAFTVLVQISNHLNDLTGFDFAGVDLTRQEVGELVAALRTTDRILDSSVSTVRFSVREGSGVSASPSRAGSELALDLSASLLRDWRKLLLATADGLDPRELFLRTGYSVDEIYSAAEGLELDDSHLDD